MAKKWKTGDTIPLNHINNLEEKAEAYDKLISEGEKENKPVEKKVAKSKE